ncbi:pentatricopeptide repeat-containing protein-like [Dorcoceras hygrometricum]|uniref:Pentatricopeptide repeat-containing protein-like n=1 Tax=Dorcoceras hygrometricum TaxID=472368 RepID=A0A2Z7AVY2_9LAMI|nr:pentatricopeptide repeat-containing protein-like [Dorcoceras hygrometricum]
MIFVIDGSSKVNRRLQLSAKVYISRLLSYMWSETEISRIVRIINDHPYPDQPLLPTLRCEIPSAALSTTFIENILGNLFAANSNGLKAYELFKYCLQSDFYTPSSDAFEKTLHILARMRYFSKVWELIERIKRTHPSLITLKSMSIVLSRIAKFQSYEETLDAFEKMEKNIFLGKKFGTEEFNVLIRVFSTQRQMKEAQSVFNKMHGRYAPNIKTMNILLLGFKESGDVTAVELFYHEMVRRGFKPNGVTYNIRIDAYCKRGHFGDALRLFEEMERAKCLPTLETITTLIHGAGLVRNSTKAKQLFDDITKRNLQPDTGAYNACMSSLIRSSDVISAVTLMEEMEMRGIEHDNVTYHTMFLGLMRSKGIDGVIQLYSKMLDKNFVPKTRTVVMLMKFFCENGRVDLGLDLWNYLVKKGQCPHSHALDLLVTGLCSRGRVEEAFDCCKQMLVRGRHASELVFEMLKRFLVQMEEFDRLGELENMTKRLKFLLPPPKDYSIGKSAFSSDNQK